MDYNRNFRLNIIIFFFQFNYDILSECLMKNGKSNYATNKDTLQLRNVSGNLTLNIFNL